MSLGVVMRRGAGLDPPSGPAALYDADTLALSNGDPVSSYIDASGHGRPVGAGGTARPTYRSAGVNGHPSVEFDGSDDVMQANTYSFDHTRPYTLIVAFAYSTLNDGAILSDADPTTGGGGDLVRLRNNAGSPEIRIFSNGGFVDIAPGLAVGANVIAIRHMAIGGGAAANMSVWINGTLRYNADQARTTTAAHAYTMGRAGPVSGALFSGHIPYLSYYVYALSDGAIIAEANALRTKYGAP